MKAEVGNEINTKTYCHKNPYACQKWVRNLVPSFLVFNYKTLNFMTFKKSRQHDPPRDDPDVGIYSKATWKY